MTVYVRYITVSIIYLIPMEKFKVLDISGDVGIKAFGKSIDEAFINAAIGMYSLITNLDSIKEKKTINVSVGSPSLDGLLVSWLNELIFNFDAYGFIGKKIEITEFTPTLTLPPGGGKGGGEATVLKVPYQVRNLIQNVMKENF